MLAFTSVVHQLKIDLVFLQLRIAQLLAWEVRFEVMVACKDDHVFCHHERYTSLGFQTFVKFQFAVLCLEEDGFFISVRLTEFDNKLGRVVQSLKEMLDLCSLRQKSTICLKLVAQIDGCREFSHLVKRYGVNGKCLVKETLA